MKVKLLVLFFITAFILPVRAEDREGAELNFHHKKWLEEEVVYIITSLEKEVFLKLSSNKERNMFIEAFWKHRDPTPGTEENETKKEHYRRLSHVNHYYGRKTPIAGWRTDRGRVYIILGEPNTVQNFDGTVDTYPSEIWFYQGKTDFGLPQGFNLVFFQEGSVGAFKLYSPLRDGPQRLMPGYDGDIMNYMAAYTKLRGLRPELARVSLSLIEGETVGSIGHPSMASDRLIQQIETLPQTQLQDKYAQKFFEFKDIVEVEYSANYVYSDTLVSVMRDSSGITFVHFVVELPRLSIGAYEDKYYTTLKLNGTVSDEGGQTIHQYEKNIRLEFNEQEMKNLSHQPFNLHDMFPLIPGNYTFSALVKNEVSKEFTSVEKPIIIPSDESSPIMSPLILGYRINQEDTSQKKPKPFRLGSLQIFFQPNRIFVKKDDLIVAFQILGLNQGLKDKGIIKFALSRMEEEIKSFTREIKEYPDSPNFVQEFPLRDFPSAHYRIRVSLLVDEQEIMFEDNEFDVTYLEAIPRPWVHSRILPDTDDAFYPYIKGRQLFNAGKTQEARPHLETAYKKRLDSVMYALELAQTYLVLTENRKIESILLPFLSQPQPRHEVFIILGESYKKMEEWGKAVEIYDKAISLFGINPTLLNSVGLSYVKLGRLDEALKAWEKSIEINPEQPQIRKNIERLKKK